MSIELELPPKTEDRKEWAQWFLKVYLLLTTLTREERPGFKYASATTVTLSASDDNPATFVLGGKLLAIVEDLTMDIATSGAGGLDTGSVAADTIYYLYAVNDSDEVSLVASVTDPNTGPTGFTNWSYLGAMLTDGSSNIPPFMHAQGTMILGATSSGWDVTASETSLTSKTVKLPTTAKHGYFRSTWSNVVTIANTLGVGPTSIESTIKHKANSATAANNNVVHWWVPILEAQTIYTITSEAADSVGVRVMGWREHPEEYQ